MDKLQFLDLTDLNPSDEEQLNSILWGCECPAAVELPPEAPPAITWVQHPPQVPMAYHQPEPVNVNGGEGMSEVEYAAVSPLMAPHTVQYTQMMQTPNVYVSNVTANVSVHGYMPSAVTYPPAVPFMPPVDPQPRKPRAAKTPTKRSPEAAVSYAPTPFTQSFHPSMYPHPQVTYYPVSIIPRPVGMSPVYAPAAAPVYSPAATFPPMAFSTPPQHLVQPPSEPREENPVFVEEEEEEKEVIEENVQEDDKPVEEKVEEPPEVPAVEIKKEEVKVEKPLATKAPPVNAFKSAPNPTQKPPFPKPKKSLDGPEFVDPPVETGPVKKSFASLFGSGTKEQVQSIQAESVSKPLAMIHPTVHNNVNNISASARSEKFISTPPVQTNSTTFSSTLKARSEKIIPKQKDFDYDINLQRLGEMLSVYQLDHKPLQLQPRGLTNRSNYCYINAILQALIACPPFYNLMKALPPSQESGTGKSRTPIIDSMVKFVNEFSLMSLNTRPVGRREKIQANKEGGSAEVVTGPAFEPVYVYKMLSAMHAAFPVEGRQEDAEEFLSFLLNGINDEMLEAMKLVEPQSNGLTNGDVTPNGDSTSSANGNHDPEQDHEWTEVVNKNNKSVITRRAEFGKTPLSAIFRGQMRSRVFRAGVENGTTDNIQPFFTLQLDVEASSVEKALELLVGKDEVVGGTCPKTNQEISISTQTSLEELPLILLLHLKCFDYKLHTCSKIIKTVEFPVDLKIDNKLCTSKSKTSSKDRQYKLLAVVYHDGKEATKGHYITDVFHTGYSSWVRYDDATVRPVTQHQVLNPRPPRVPYLLYYRRCDTLTPAPAPPHVNR